MYKEKFKKLFKEMIEVEKLTQGINKYALAVGFFIGKGCDFKQADELAKEILNGSNKQD